jgi:hypothetical protein
VKKDLASRDGPASIGPKESPSTISADEARLFDWSSIDDHFSGDVDPLATDRGHRLD